MKFSTLGAVIGGALLCVSQASFAATDLLTAWQAAQHNDPEFAAAVSEKKAGDTQRKQGLAMLLPQVQAVGGVGRATMASATSGAQFSAPSFGPPSTVDFNNSIDNGDSSRWAVSARQPLYDAERFAGYAQAQRMTELADLKYRVAEQQLALRVAQVYFDCVRSEQRLQTLRALKSAALNARDEADARFKVGDSPITDRDDAQARFDMFTAEEIAAVSDLQQRRSAFTAVTGLDASDLMIVVSAAPARDETLASWQTRAQAQNPLIAMRRAGVDIADSEIDKFRLLTSPKVELVAQVGEDRLDGSGKYGDAFINSSGWAVGVQVTVPIFTGGMRSAKREAAAAHAEQSRFDLDAVQALVKRQTETAWLGVSAGAARAGALQQAQASAERRLQSTRTGRRVGARTTLDELNAEADLYNAQSALTDARCNLLISHLQLDASAGLLDANSVARINAALVPDATEKADAKKAASQKAVSQK